MKIIKKVIDTTKKAVISQILSLAMNASDNNLIRMATLAGKLTTDSSYKKAIATFKDLVKNKDPRLGVLKRINTQLHPNARKKLIENVFINSYLTATKTRNAFEKKEGFAPPFLLVISPTMRCNLRCVGCYAGEYTQKDDLPYEELTRIVAEAKAIGVHLITITGGEPFFRKDDLLKLFKEHPDVYFHTYTNGTLFTKELAEQLAELGNCSPMISVEGYETETDNRRGNKVYSRLMESMDYLREAGVLFGFSNTHTTLNTDLILKPEFVDKMIEKGAIVGWFFQYIPIGLKPDVKLMPTPKDRQKLREMTIEVRKTKPIFVGDFWNDGEMVNGCLAGRRYLHIISTGDVEPCVFVHFAIDNIKEKSLVEVLRNPVFKDIREKGVLRNNLLMPCMIIDNPDRLRQLVKKYNMKPSHPGADSIINDPTIRAHLDEYSKKWKNITDPIWEEKHHGETKELTLWEQEESKTQHSARPCCAVKAK